MRNTKKWLVILLAVVMLVSNLSVTAMATEPSPPSRWTSPSQPRRVPSCRSGSLHPRPRPFLTASWS
jgi:hypothetical protein